MRNDFTVILIWKKLSKSSWRRILTENYCSFYRYVILDDVPSFRDQLYVHFQNWISQAGVYLWRTLMQFLFRNSIGINSFLVKWYHSITWSGFENPWLRMMENLSSNWLFITRKLLSGWFEWWRFRCDECRDSPQCSRNSMKPFKLRNGTRRSSQSLRRWKWKDISKALSASIRYFPAKNYRCWTCCRQERQQKLFCIVPVVCVAKKASVFKHHGSKDVNQTERRIIRPAGESRRVGDSVHRFVFDQHVVNGCRRYHQFPVIQCGCSHRYTCKL